MIRGTAIGHHSVYVKQSSALSVLRSLSVAFSLLVVIIMIVSSIFPALMCSSKAPYTVLGIDEAYAASGASRYDDNGNPIDESEALRANNGSSDSTEQDRQSNTVWGLDSYGESGSVYNGGAGSSGSSGSSSGTSANYMDFDVTKIFNPGGEPTLLPKGAQMTEEVVDRFVLPIAILLASWRVLYIGIFCIMANVDPLKMREWKDNGFDDFGAKGDMPRDWGHDVLKKQVGRMIIGFALVFGVWIVIRLGVWAAVAVLGLF